MIFLTCIFVVVSLLGYESKVVKTLKKKDLKDTKPSDEIVTKLEKVYNGELCILREIYCAKLKDTEPAKQPLLECQNNGVQSGMSSFSVYECKDVIDIEDKQGPSDKITVLDVEVSAFLKDSDQGQLAQTVEEIDEDQIFNPYTGPRHQTLIVPKRASFLEEKEGWLLKKSSKSIFGVSVWQRRFFTLQKGKLLIFHSQKEQQIGGKRTTIDMKQVQSVCFHYDKDAPVKSKKLFKHGLDESRFDVYTAQRVFSFKADEMSHDQMEDSVSWVASLKVAMEFFA